MGSRYSSLMIPIIASARFYRNRVRFNEQIFEDRIKLVMGFHCCCDVACPKCGHHPRDLSRNNVGSNTDDSVRSDSHERQRQRIIAR